MSSRVNNDRSAEFSLSEKEFTFICKLVYERTGIVLDERKREMVYRRLMRRTRDLKLTSFKAYCHLLQQNNEGELTSFINAITTNLTSFFREMHHFEHLTKQFLPEHIQLYAHTRKLRIWSAACSTGEEPYSLAITLLQFMPVLINNWDVKILATDLDTDVLDSARGGVYQTESIKDLSESVRKKWFLRGDEVNAGNIKVVQKLADLITFMPLNLLDNWPMRGPFDVIMCRNVLIYFDRPTQAKLIQRFYQMLRPGGILMLGHSESLPKDNKVFDMLGRTIFAKKSSPDLHPVKAL